MSKEKDERENESEILVVCTNTWVLYAKVPSVVRTEPKRTVGSSVARAAAVPGSPQACEMEMGPNPTKSQKSCRIVSVADRNWEVESFGKVV